MPAKGVFLSQNLVNAAKSTSSLLQGQCRPRYLRRILHALDSIFSNASEIGVSLTQSLNIICMHEGVSYCFREKKKEIFFLLRDRRKIHIQFQED